MAEEEEDWQDYKLGGYHPVSIGDSFSDNRYVVVRKLGWGHFSTVWLARDELMQRHVALKVVKSAPRYTETAVDEIKLLQRLVQSADPTKPSSHSGRSHVISFLDHFRHKGPNGTHVCMVFEVLGENLLGLVKRHQNKGVPMPLVKQIAKQVLLGLDYMHRCCEVIHTDLKPENVLIYIPEVESVIQSELQLSASARADPQHAPTHHKITGVPASGGRGANQTPGPRHLGINVNVNITGSQPLSSSPTGSYVSLSALSSGSIGRAKAVGDKWGLGMLKISEDDGGAASKSKEGGDLGMSSLTLSKSAPADMTPVHGPTPPPPPLGLDVPRSDHRPVEGEEGWVEEVVDADLDYEMIMVKIADLGNATWTNHHFTNDIQTRQYRCPEVIIGSTTWGTSTDIWSLACVLFELMTGGDYLFDPAPAPKGANGVPRYTKDDDHLAQIIELLGELPPHVLKSGRWTSDFFSPEGKLIHIQNLRPWPLAAVLHDKYLVPQEEAEAIAAFFLPMLHLDPDKRVSAGELVKHEWLRDVPDLEADFMLLREKEVVGDRDAMKPVDESGAPVLASPTTPTTRQ
ncbi:kinase-like domain-containing protein [Roridomyces roridus]|uniref:non-specific serine/threonine protein kinase n=1 Tax=Roridomyces roridus TaxID=1738132 RepID=A0AAD7FI02_9AGAR|nr:kinase-like domain-containing protein [Roridomyces roridus]